MAVDYLKLIKKKKNKSQIHLSIHDLDTYCEYLLNDTNKYINYSNLTNLKDFIELIDEQVFKSNDAKLARYFFVKFYLEAKLDRGIINHKLALNYVFEHCSPKFQAIIKREITGAITPGTLSKKDIDFINGLIFTQLNIAFMHDYKGALTQMLEDLENNEFGRDVSDCESAIKLMQAILGDLTKAQRRSRQENRFDLTDGEHLNALLIEAAERALSENQYLQTGWQGMNNMLNGGFENGRIYNFIGATGGFKSGLLLNIMKQIKLYNKGKEHKDPTKRPTILFLSQENNIWETIYRLFGIFGTTENIKKYTVKQIIDILQNGGFTTVVDEQDINIEFRYYGNMDISVPDIRGMCEELDNSGKEVICIIQDYIERLRPPVMSAEKRIQLFDISNQLHDLAVELDVPIITGSQLNRSGVATIEDLQSSNKKDIGRNIGSKDISESFAMLKNFDVNIAIVVEYDSGEERFYLSFRSLKFRGDDTDTLKYFLQPFAGKNSKIQLMDDINTVRLYKLSMTEDSEAKIADDINTLQEITRRTDRSFLEPINDIAETQCEEFMEAVSNDLDRNFQHNGEEFLRDEEGFIILIRHTDLDLSGLSNVHSTVHG